MLVTPVLLPIMTAYGVDPIHFGIILICCCGIGFSTPPLGENMFIASGIANMSLEEISLKALPLVAINIAVIASLMPCSSVKRSMSALRRAASIFTLSKGCSYSAL